MTMMKGTLEELGLPTAGALTLDIEQMFGTWPRRIATVRYNIDELVKAESTPFDNDPLHPLQSVFDQCVSQAVSGKGEERHGLGVDFMDQPWKQIADRHGLGFLVGQADKKLDEAAKFLQQHPDQDGVAFWKREVLGAINYLAMAMLFVEETCVEPDGENDEPCECNGCSGCGSDEPLPEASPETKGQCNTERACGACWSGQGECENKAPVHFKFSPVTGTSLMLDSNGESGITADWFNTNFGPVAWLYNPYTGDQRDPRDIGSDPYGTLVVPPGIAPTEATAQ